jgi:hypothetical protein
VLLPEPERPLMIISCISGSDRLGFACETE